MINFYIEYNPYRVICTFKKNGKELSNNSKIGAKSNERLQVLLNKGSNWDGLASEIAKVCNDDEIDITFKGRKIDFDDLKYSIDRYDGNVKFKLNFNEGKNDHDIIKELDKLFDEIKEKDIPEFKENNSYGKTIFDSYNEVKNGIFEVSVIATMSSGKSTLINSLLHTELLPSENKACTATIVRILDNNKMDNYEAECYGSDNSTIIHSRSSVGLDDIKSYNSDERVQYINIEGSVPAIPSDKIKLCLRDTPGPNNSRDENHEILTRSIIKKTNAVILYVMNATQIGIKDDKELLKDISKEMERAGKQSRDRFIFVVNKCDELDEEKGETIDKLLSDVADYLKGFGIIEPTLIPTSARLAFLIRKEQNSEKLTRQERKELLSVDDFVKSPLLHYEDYATLTPTVHEKLKDEVTKYHADEEDWDYEALVHTGIRCVEETIVEYIEKYAYPMKINDAIREIVQILDDLDMKAKFDKSIAEDSDKLQEVRAQIQESIRKHDDSKNIRDEYKNRVKTISLDSLDKDEIEFEIENELQKITKPYDGMTSIDKIEADEVISKFQRKLRDFQNKCESNITREIDESIFTKCKEMIDEYSKVIAAIINEINIDGYSFDKIVAFKKIDISNIDDIVSKNESTRYRSETRWKDNPEREGFLGKFKFWKKKKISYQIVIEDGINVNVKNIIVDVASKFNKDIKDNIKSMFIEAENQVNEYKNVFSINIDNIDNEIKKILEKLYKDTSESQDIIKRVEKNKELSKWVEEKESEINTLLSF